MKRISNYHIFLILVFLAFWIWAAINPLYRDGWLMENYLVFIFVPIIILSAIYFKLSNVSYTLLTIFMILHVIGSHYTYAEVPFGYILQEWFGSSRNMYDRLVHFSFGFLLAYPIREIIVRISKARGFWSYYIPIDIVLAFSGLYEIIEWLAVEFFANPDAGLAFLGAQGDIWDAQKDMILATFGAIITMTVVFLINLSINKNAIKEMKESFRIPEGDSPLGEVKIREYMKSGR